MAPACRIVFADRLTETGCLFKLGVKVNNALEHTIREVLAKFAKDLSAHLGTNIIHACKNHNVYIMFLLIAQHFKS